MLKYQKSAWNLKNTANVPARPWVTKRTEIGCTGLKQWRTFAGFPDSCSMCISDTCNLLKHCVLFLEQKCLCVCVCVYLCTYMQTGDFIINLFPYHTLMLNISSLKGRGVDKWKTPNVVFKVKNPTHNGNEVSVFHLLITVLQFSLLGCSKLVSWEVSIVGLG